MGLGLMIVLLAGGALRVWYASAQLHINRFEDERYSLQNVRKLYHLGDYEPASGYYPSPVFNAPQVWILRASQSAYERTGRETFRAVGDDGRLLPTGFFLTRLYQALCGTLTLALVFAIGRRLASPQVGLLAAGILAFLPWMLHSSGYNKPDALLVFGACLSFWTALRALDLGRTRDYLFAGAAIAIAMSAKLTGGFVAVPLTVGTLFFLRSDERLRRIYLLALAAVTSAVTFIVLNPYWKAYLHFIQGLQRDYAGRTEASPFDIPLRLVEMHVDRLLFGPVFGVAALIATAGLTARCVITLGRRAGQAPGDSDGREPWRYRSWTALLGFPLIYTAAYAAQTSYFKANNFLPLVPVTALALATGLHGLWRYLAERLPARWSPAVGVTAAAVLILTFAVPGLRYVERSVVPTTYDAARIWLQKGFDPAIARLVYRERWTPPWPAWEGRRQLHQGLSAEANLDRVDLEIARDADAVVLRLGHDRKDLEALESQLKADGWGQVLELSPRFAHMRGPRLLAARSAWRRVVKVGAEPEECGPGCFRTELPEDFEAAHRTSAFLWLPTSFSPPSDPPALQLGDGRTLTLHHASKKGHGHLFVTPRFRVEPGTELRFQAPQEFGPGFSVVQIELHGWSRGPQSN
ncbi:MAG: glycosyltransferase family 39 protein [Acidobacteriota bacterium]